MNTVLIVDNDRDTADSLALLLGMWGFTAVVAYDGCAGWDLAQESRPAVALIDLAMPRLNGLELARMVRQEPTLEGTVLIAMTGYGREADCRLTREAGFMCHLTKPTEPEVLHELLDAVAGAPLSPTTTFCHRGMAVAGS